MTHRGRGILLLCCVGPAWAAGCRKSPAPGRARIEKITTATGVEMVRIPAGEFVLGGDGGEADERPARRVGVGAFWMDVREVTQKSYRAMMGTNPAKSKGPDKPVEQLSWFAAVKYCNMRSLREGLACCYDTTTLACDFEADGYRLPTEAEWEYACRAGSRTAYSFGADPAGLGRCAWFKANAGKTTHPVGRKRPNAWGLCDMHGNVWEWCNDFYAAGAYRSAGGRDPRGPAAGKLRVLRGGGFRSDAANCRCSARHSEPPGLADVCFGYEAYGFRCVRRAPARGPSSAGGDVSRPSSAAGARRSTAPSGRGRPAGASGG